MLNEQVLRVLRIVPFLLCAWVMLCLSSAITLERAIWFQVLYISCLVLSLFRPIWAVGVLLVLMPWLGGSQPGYEHTLRFLLLVSGVALGISLNLIRMSWTDNQRARVLIDWSNPLSFAMLVYWMVAGLSLVIVPTNRTLNSLIWFDHHLARFFLGLPGSPLYPWLSFVTLSMAFVFFIQMVVWIKNDIRVAIKMIGAILIGSLITILVGFLDYYDFINLKFARPDNYEEYFGIYYRFQHLTSVFGNPGWLTQFLTLTAPAMMAIILLPLRRSFVLILLVAVMVLTEWCILLAYQRGGWLSYPLTLIIIWFCVYVVSTQEGEAGNVWKKLKKSFLKIVITLPLTLILSLSLVYFIAKVQPEYRQNVDGFVERASSIKNVNDRLAFWYPTLKLFKQHPILGGGVDSFQNQYERSFLNEGHLCSHDDPYTTGAHGSAHNLYFQILAGKGIVGLFSLFGVMIAAIYLAWRGVFAKSIKSTMIRSREQKLVLMMGMAYVFALAIYSNVGEIFYFPASYLVFATFMGAAAGAGEGLASLSSRFKFGVWILLVIALIAHLLLEKFGGLACY